MSNDEYIKFYDEIKDLQKYVEILGISTSDQASYLKELIAQIAIDEKDSFSKSSFDLFEIKKNLTDMQRTLEALDSKTNNIKKSIESLELKTCDKNFDSSLINVIDDVKKSIDGILNALNSVDYVVMENDNIKILDELSVLSKKITEIQDKKKNWTWVVELLYKVILTITIVIGVFGFGK